MLGEFKNNSCYKNSIQEEGGNNINNSIDNSEEVLLKLKTKKTTIID
jgi:hypothetical protein